MQLPETQAALVILCKRPRLGEGKQRLAESIGTEAAYKIATKLFDCALEDAVQWTGPVILSPSRHEDSDWAYQQADAAGIEFVQVIPQQTGNLGERINQLDQTIRQFGQPNTVFIGTDAPMLTAKHYAEVIAQLAGNDIVLSQAEDGGLVIMANAQPWPVLTELPWSQVTLGDEINHCCQQNGLKVGFSKSGYDIDFKEDLLRFYQEFKETDVPARQALITTIEHLGIK